MAICPNCKQELLKQDNGNYHCPYCGKTYVPKQKSAPAPQQPAEKQAETPQPKQAEAQQSQNGSSDEIAELKARIAALEAEKQETRQIKQSAKPQSTFGAKVSAVTSKVAATPAWAWFKKHWYIAVASVLGLIIFITLLSTLVGIRGIYVNTLNPNEFYSFTATTYEYHGVSLFGGGDYVDKGTWKKSGNKLLFTYNDEDFGKITEENVILQNQNDKMLVLEDEFGIQKTFKRVNLVNYSAVATKVKITFDANGGSLKKQDSSSVSGSTQTYKTKIGNKINMDLEATRNDDNIRFMGWYTEPYGYTSNTSQQYTDGYRVWESVTYYANWYNPTEYNISLGGASVTIHEGDLLLPKIQELNKQLSSDITYECYFDGKAIDENTIYTPKYKLTRKLISINNNITKIPDYAFQYCTNTSITIPDSVKSIGANAFSNCSELTSVTLGNKVTNIGDWAFYGCGKLTTATIPDSVTSISSWTFAYCTELTSLIIGNGVTSIGASAFYNCNKLTNITGADNVTYIASGVLNDTAWYNNQPDGILYIGKMVYRYKGTMPDNSSVIIENGIESIGDYAFYECGGLTSIIIPDSVNNIGDNAFYGCNNLEVATIPALAIKYMPRTIQSVKITSGDSIDYAAFSGCSELRSVTIPDSVTSIGSSAFSGCSGLTEITIPDSVTSIGRGAFWGCGGLTSITIPFVGESKNSIDASESTLFGHIFGSSNYEGGIRIDQYYDRERSWYYCIPTSLKKVTVTGGNILYGAFYNCFNLTSVTIGDGVTSIGYDAFVGCSGLEAVYITDIAKWCGISFGGSNANPLYYAHNLYLNGELVTDLVIPDSVTSISSSAFYGCSGLTSVTIPDNVTSIGRGAFWNCVHLVEVYNKSSLDITIGSTANGYVSYYAKNIYTSAGGSKLTTTSDGFVIYDNTTLVKYFGNATEIIIPDNVTSIGDYAFYECSGLTSVTIPNSVTSISSYVFYGCSGLTSITIPDSLTSIGDYAFCWCSGLTSLTIPDSVTNIGYDAFYNCNGLTSVIIGIGVINIGDYAFCRCSGLTNITIPDSVTNIGDAAFEYCRSLTCVNFGGTKAQWEEIYKGASWTYDTGDYIVHCTDGDLDKYGNEI